MCAILFCCDALFAFAVLMTSQLCFFLPQWRRTLSASQHCNRGHETWITQSSTEPFRFHDDNEVSLNIHTNTIEQSERDEGKGRKKSTLMKVEAVIWNWKNMRIVSGCIPSGCLAVTGLELHCLMYTHAPSPFPFHYSNLQTAVSCTLGPTPCCSRYLLNTFFTPKTFFHLSCHLQLPWPWKHARGSEREE